MAAKKKVTRSQTARKSTRQNTRPNRATARRGSSTTRSSNSTLKSLFFPGSSRSNGVNIQRKDDFSTNFTMGGTLVDIQSKKQAGKMKVDFLIAGDDINFKGDLLLSERKYDAFGKLLGNMVSRVRKFTNL